MDWLIAPRFFKNSRGFYRGSVISESIMLIRVILLLKTVL